MVWPTDYDVKLDEYDAMDLPGQQLAASQASSTLDHILHLDVTAPAPCQRLTAIVASIGKSSRDIESIEKMLAAGMNIALINFVFGKLDEHIETIKNIREATKNYSRSVGRTCPLAIAGMLYGKKIRTGTILPTFGEKVELKAGENLRLTTDETYRERCSENIVYVDYMNLSEQVTKGTKVYLDNEKIMLLVDVVSKTTVTCKIVVGGHLGSNKDVFVSNTVLDMPNYSERDKELIEIAIRNQLDILIAPFVNSTDAITELRHLMGERGRRIAIVANIQTIEGFHNFDDILAKTNGVMITRQELGSDISPNKLVIAQKNMIIRANKANIPVLVNAHILKSMRKKRAPLRSELCDVANCVLDGADGLVLSAETAIGQSPVDTIRVITEVCKEAESCVWSERMFLEMMNKTPMPCDQTTGTALSAVLAAQRLLAAAIIVMTTSGKTAQIISRYKPRCPIVAVTRYAAIARQLHLWRAIMPLVYEETPKSDWEQDMKERIKFCTSWAMERGFMRVGDPYVLVSGFVGAGASNTARIEYATDDVE
ncbi:pyruvate kinase-like [Aricia agestis]|uniref:pyruvate kinase-like n=1 Tax=Aricia agestis TaxID=91739 RepID=UPI001C2047AC|nr:pyruvate kinase-like [Aricia agestis]